MHARSHQVGQFSSLNLRTETHGDKKVPGADLQISFVAKNDILAEFHPALKSMLYREPEPAEMDMVDKAQVGDGPPDRTRLIFGAKLPSIPWKHEVVGAVFVVHYGTGNKSDITLHNATVDKFHFDPMDGGSVRIHIRVKCNPDEKAVGKLSLLMGNEVEFSMEPPEASEMPDAA